MKCSKCCRVFRRPRGSGRAPLYCSTGCRRAAEFELRRLQNRLEAAEAEVLRRRRLLDGYGPYEPEDDDHVDLDWWVAEVDRLEARMRELLEVGE